MLGKTHNLFAFGTLITLATYSNIEINRTTAIVAVIICIVGSMLPDIDQASNRLWDLLPGGDWLGKILRRLFLGHRTLSHSIIGTYLVYRLVGWSSDRLLNWEYVDTSIIVTSMMVGYISHLLLDGLTEEGLPLLFPIKWKFGIPPIRSWRIKTGKWFEKIVVLPSVVVYILILLYQKWPQILRPLM